MQPRTHADLLKAFRKSLGLTQGELAEKLGISPKQIGSYEQGVAKNIPHEVIRKLVDQFSVPLEAFFSETPVVPGNPPPEGEAPKPNVYMETSAKAGGGYERGFSDESEAESLVPFFLPNISPGIHFAIVIDGDSMTPYIPNGSIVVGKKALERTYFKEGKVYILRTPGGYQCKRLYKHGEDGVLLVSDNPAYPPVPLPAREIQDLYALVKVIVDPN